MGCKAGKTDMADSLHKNNRGILGRLQDYDEYVTHKLYQLGLCVPRFVWKALEYSGDGFVWLALASLLLVGHAVVLEKEQEALSRTWYGLVLHRIGMVDELLGPNLMLGLLVDLVEVGLLKGMFKRPRPGHNALAGDMKIVVAVDAHSFPSGHSSRCVFCFPFCSGCLLARMFSFSIRIMVANKSKTIMQSVFHSSSSETIVSTLLLCIEKCLSHMGRGCGAVKVHDGQASHF